MVWLKALCGWTVHDRSAALFTVCLRDMFGFACPVVGEEYDCAVAVVPSHNGSVIRWPVAALSMWYL